MSAYLDQIRDCTGLYDDEREKLGELLDTWSSKLERNKLKTCYYEAKEQLKNLGIAVPDEFANIEIAVEWPAKAVDYMAARSIFDGFSYQGEDNEMLERIVDDNDLVLAYDQAVTSELVNSCVFSTVGKGGEGEPTVVINFYTAETATALWNYRKKRIDWGLVVTDLCKNPKTGAVEPFQVMMHSDTYVYVITRGDDEKWRSVRARHSMGRPMMEVMAYKPSIKRPFGKSRISRTVMSLTDRAMRTGLRAEIGSEFFTSPQKYLLGASDDDFDMDRWTAYLGHIFVATKDEDGDVPKYGQLPQASMQPHTEYMRDLAAQFAGATNLPISSLGVIHDNPASAEAMYVAKEDLVIDAKALNRVNGKALVRIARMALCVAQNKPLSELTDDERAIDAHFVNPATPSVVSQASAMVQACAPAPWIAETEVYLEEIGFDDSTRRRLMDAKKALEAKQMMGQMLLQAPQEPKQEKRRDATMYEMASILKSYRSGKISMMNAITLFDRIGIEEDEAKAMLYDAGDIIDATGAAA